MHRRAHGGAWSVAALLIGSCTAVEAGEPPRMPTSYSSGAAAPTSNTSTFAPAGTATTPTAAVPMPTAIDFDANSGAMEIIATPFVPYASAHALRGQPASQAEIVSAAPPPISISPAIDSGRLVPIELSAEEKSLLEKVLRGVAVRQEVPAPNLASVADSTPATRTPDEETKSSQSAVAEKSKQAASAIVEATKTSSVPVADAAPKEPEPSAAKITPLPPLDKEVPSQFKLPANLPQPPIPLEFPRTGS